MKYDAFISYRRENGFLMAQVIHDRLEEKGLRCFLDLEELRSGQFDEKIYVAIEEAHSFILILPKNALNRCSNEDDWVRKEILAAIKYNKTIIPVMYDGFKWPKKWDEKIPPEIRRLENTNGVSGTQEYLSAMIDKIISYMPNGVNTSTSKLNQNGSLIPTNTYDFFKYALEFADESSTVDMAFHAGSEWQRNSDKVELLNEIFNRKIKLRVLANSNDIVSNVTKSMTQPLKRYVGFDESLNEWIDLAKAYPDFVEVKIPNVPLLHRLYIISNEKSGCANVKYYTYGNYTPDKDFRLSFGFGTKEYNLYVDEFEYLWENSTNAEIDL